MVCPSAGALATISLPTVNTPPGRLSTTICCPSDSLSFCATKRVMMSAVAPGGMGTIQRIGLFGYGCSAAPAIGAHARSATAQSVFRNDLIRTPHIFWGEILATDG